MAVTMVIPADLGYNSVIEIPYQGENHVYRVGQEYTMPDYDAAVIRQMADDKKRGSAPRGTDPLDGTETLVEMVIPAGLSDTDTLALVINGKTLRYTVGDTCMVPDYVRAYIRALAEAKAGARSEDARADVYEGATTSRRIAAGAVTADKIADGSITREKLSENARVEGQLDAAALTSAVFGGRSAQETGTYQLYVYTASSTLAAGGYTATVPIDGENTLIAFVTPSALSSGQKLKFDALGKKLYTVCTDTVYKKADELLAFTLVSGTTYQYTASSAMATGRYFCKLGTGAVYYAVSVGTAALASGDVISINTANSTVSATTGGTATVACTPLTALSFSQTPVSAVYPNPDHPEPFTHVALADVRVCGKNMLPVTARGGAAGGLSWTRMADGAVRVAGVTTAPVQIPLCGSSTTPKAESPLILSEGAYLFSGNDNAIASKWYLDDADTVSSVARGQTITVAAGHHAYLQYAYAAWASGKTVSADIYAQVARVEAGTDAGEYEPYRGDTYSLSGGVRADALTDKALTLYGLDLGTEQPAEYTFRDANGHYWVTDTYDGVTGILKRRLRTYTFDSTANWQYSAGQSLTNTAVYTVSGVMSDRRHGTGNANVPIFCTAFKAFRTWEDREYMMLPARGADYFGDCIYLRIQKDRLSALTGAALKTWIAAQSPIKVLYQLETPIVTYIGPLSDGPIVSSARRTEVSANDIAFIEHSRRALSADELLKGVRAAYGAKSAQSPLYGKSVAWHGDSLAIGRDSAGNVRNYTGVITKRNNMAATFFAYGGATVTTGVTGVEHSVATELANMTDVYDYVIVEGGVNDASKIASSAISLGDISSGYDASLTTTQFCGAFESVCKKLCALAARGCKVGFVFVHGIFAADHTYNASMRAKMKSMLEKWGVPYLDLQTRIPPLNLIPDLKSAYTIGGDGWHPNLQGVTVFYLNQVESWMKGL